MQIYNHVWKSFSLSSWQCMTDCCPPGTVQRLTVTTQQSNTLNKVHLFIHKYLVHKPHSCIIHRSVLELWIMCTDIKYNAAVTPGVAQHNLSNWNNKTLKSYVLLHSVTFRSVYIPELRSLWAWEYVGSVLISFQLTMISIVNINREK